MAEARFKSTSVDPAVLRFLQCLEPNGTSDEAQWYRSLKARIERECFQRDLKESGGDKLDMSEGALRTIRILGTACGHITFCRAPFWPRTGATTTV